jgi:hypothetical protein
MKGLKCMVERAEVHRNKTTKDGNTEEVELEIISQGQERERRRKG